MKPGDVYVGVVDLFSVLIPGAILSAYLDARGAVGWLEPFAAIRKSNASSWIAFVVASYVLGHFLFFVAAQLDRIADITRRGWWKNEAARLAAEQRKMQFFAVDEDAKSPMNTFNWAKATVLLRCREATGDVSRYEADQKFFRSLCMLALGIGAHQLVIKNWIASSISLVLAFAAFIRYVERRHKSVQWAYYYALASEQPSKSAKPPPSSKNASSGVGERHNG